MEVFEEKVVGVWIFLPQKECPFPIAVICQHAAVIFACFFLFCREIFSNMPVPYLSHGSRFRDSKIGR